MLRKILTLVYYILFRLLFVSEVWSCITSSLVQVFLIAFLTAFLANFAPQNLLFTIVVISNCYLKCEPDSLCSGYSNWVSIPGPEKLIKAPHHYHLPGFALFVVVCNFGLIFVSVNFLLV